MDSERVDELLRINAELAAEIRRLTLDGAESPRSGQMTTARRLGHLIDERDALLAERDNLREEYLALGARYDQLGHDNAIYVTEITRLRSGFRGLLRRLRARLAGR